MSTLQQIIVAVASLVLYLAHAKRRSACVVVAAEVSA